jgi:hypothetical protein
MGRPPELAVVPGVMCDGVGPVDVLSPAVVLTVVLLKELVPDLAAVALTPFSFDREVAVPWEAMSVTIFVMRLVNGGGTTGRLAYDGWGMPGGPSSSLSSSLHIALSASLADTSVIRRVLGPGRRRSGCL